MKSLLKASSVASLLLLYKDKNNSIDKTKGSTECTLKLWTNYICNNMFAIRENYSVSNFTNKETILHQSAKDTIEKKIYGLALPQNISKKKKLLLLCSHEEYNIPGKPIINAIKEHLDKQFEITTWMDNIVFPIAETRSSIEMFLQSMYSFDGVILLLTGDDIRQTTDGRTEQVVRDNLIFELGACMAHFGPKRTFVMIPDEDFNGNTVTLPSYFRGSHLYRFRRTNPIGGTSNACGQIMTTFDTVDYKYCDIGLPARMSVNSYIDAFLAKVVSHVNEKRCNCVLHNCIEECNGNYKIGVVLDESVLTHREGTWSATNNLCNKNDLTKTSISFNNNRDINLMFKVIDNEVWIIDVPTIMGAFIKNINELNTFWGTRGVKKFVHMMIKSELEKFTNSIIEICKNDYKNVRIIENIEDLGLTS